MLRIAQNEVEREVMLARRRLGPESVAVAESEVKLAELQRREGDLAAARRLLDGVLALHRPSFDEGPVLAMDALETLGKVLRDQGHVGRALAAAEEGLAIRRQRAAPPDERLARMLGLAGELRRAAGDAAGARQLLEEAAGVRRALPAAAGATSR